MCIAIAHQCHPSGQMDCGNVCCSMNSGGDSDVGGTLLPHTHISDTRLTRSCSLCAWLILVWQPATNDPNTRHSEALCHILRKKRSAALDGDFCHFWFGYVKRGSSDHYLLHGSTYDLFVSPWGALWAMWCFIFVSIPRDVGKENPMGLSIANFLFVMTLYNNWPWQNSTRVFCSPDHLIINYLAPKSFYLAYLRGTPAI